MIYLSLKGMCVVGRLEIQFGVGNLLKWTLLTGGVQEGVQSQI